MQNEMDKLVNIVMDHIKDIEMIFNYAIESKTEDHEQMAKFYIDSAKERFEMLTKTQNKIHNLFKSLEENDKDIHNKNSSMPNRNDYIHKYYLEKTCELNYKLSNFKV